MILRPQSHNFHHDLFFNLTVGMTGKSAVAPFTTFTGRDGIDTLPVASPSHLAVTVIVPGVS